MRTQSEKRTATEEQTARTAETNARSARGARRAWMPHARRKQMKQRARRSVKRHYGVMLSVCLLAILLGTEFTGSLDFLKVQRPTDIQLEKEMLEESEFGIEQNGVWKVVTEALEGRLDEGVQDADRLTAEAIKKNEASGEKVLGRTGGDSIDWDFRRGRCFCLSAFWC